MNGTPDDRYFEWLYASIGSVRNRNPSRSYWSLAKKLYSQPFVWFVPNDDNRALDGVELRQLFISDWGREGITRHWLELDCSMLEMLIALSRRASYESYGTPGGWFWKFMENLGIRYTDDLIEISIEEEIDDAVMRINERTYGANGEGGLFPLKRPHTDQRDTELWYQLMAYLDEIEVGLSSGPRT